MPGMSVRFSILPPVTQIWTWLSVISQVAKGVISTSSNAITEGVAGEELGREYLTRALIAGYTLIDCREIFLNGLIISLAASVAGATRDTLRAESRGLTPPRDKSSLKDSSKFMPDGTWLGRYSSRSRSVWICSAGLRLAVAENITEGF